jgi:methyl-accepting chemotaxis protein
MKMAGKIKDLFAKSLLNKLVALFLVVAMIPIIIVGIISYTEAKSALKKLQYSEFDAITTLKKEHLITYLKSKLDILTVFTHSQDVKNAYDLLKKYEDQGNGTSTNQLNVETAEYKKIYDNIDPIFRRYITSGITNDILLICSADTDGHIMYSTARESDLGTNLNTGPYKDSALAKVFAKTVKDRKPTMVDFSIYQPSNTAAMFIGAPVIDEYGNDYAVLVFQINIPEINAIMTERTGLGDTGETYLVGYDQFMRSDSRFESVSTVMQKKVDTEATRAIQQGRSGHIIGKDYRGVLVLSAFTHVGLDETFGTDFEWGIISKIDITEASAPARRLGQYIFLTAIIIGAVVAVSSYFLARGIAGPIRDISKGMVSIADGDLTIDAPSHKRKDEIGVLAETFHTMLENNRTQIQMIVEGANVLASSVSEIQATTVQISANAAETAAAINETTTTSEEVRQTAMISNQKAKEVSNNAQKAVQISQDVKKSAHDVIEEMNHIKREMDLIAESMVKLSEQSQYIGEIIAVVDDLSEQSNLLAVNAAIEAAKAGEQGKGFAVVASEIRNLAEQSKSSTSRVREILNFIQKATSTSVMSTEQGNKVVDIGIKQSTQSNEDLAKLIESILESAQSASQISVSSQQQMIGIEQAVQAMENIRQASLQHVDSAKQLENAAQNLNELGIRQKQLADKYKV